MANETTERSFSEYTRKKKEDETKQKLYYEMKHIYIEKDSQVASNCEELQSEIYVHMKARSTRRNGKIL